MRRGNNNARWPRGPQRPNGRRVFNPNRALESSTPDGGKVRGNAGQLYERYTGLARDAQSSGDRISAEAYLQYAEHYYRVMSAAGPRRPNGHGDEDRSGDGPGGPPAGDLGGAAPAAQPGAGGDLAGGGRP